MSSASVAPSAEEVAKPPILVPGGPPPEAPIDAAPIDAVPIEAVPAPTPIDFGDVPPVHVQIWNGIGSAAEWLFGAASIGVGRAALAAIPILNLVSLGYLLEVAGRIARTGHFSAGFIGYRLAARAGTIAVCVTLAVLPLWFLSVAAHSAALIDPTSDITRAWNLGLYLATAAAAFHVVSAIYAGGRFRDFLWPLFQPVYGPLASIGSFFAGGSIWDAWSWLPPVKLLGDLFRGEAYTKASEGVDQYLHRLRLPYYFWLGARGLVGTFLWLAIPSTLIALGTHLAPPAGGLIAFLGAVLMAIVLFYLPFLQVHFAAEDRFAAFWEIGAVRRQFYRAPWCFWLALTITLALSLPLYLLQIEVVPRDAAWLPALVYIAFILPAKFVLGWALSWGRVGEPTEEGMEPKRDHDAFFLWIWSARGLMIPVVIFYTFFLYLSQYTSWNGSQTLFQQHAFMLPVPSFAW